MFSLTFIRAFLVHSDYLFGFQSSRRGRFFIPVIRLFSETNLSVRIMGRSSCWFSDLLLVWVSAFLFGRHFLNESSFWRESSCCICDLLFGCQLGTHFHKKSPFWGKDCCWVVDLLFGCQSSCWENISSKSLLSGAGLSVGFVTSCLGAVLPVGKTFS